MFCFRGQLSWLKSRWKFCFFSLALIPNDIHFLKAELLWICSSQRCVQTKFGGSLTGYFPSRSFLLFSFSFSLSFSIPCSFSICNWFHHAKSYENSNSTVIILSICYVLPFQIWMLLLTLQCLQITTLCSEFILVISRELGHAQSYLEISQNRSTSFSVLIF